MIVRPSPTAVTTPVPSTVATVGFDDVKLAAAPTLGPINVSPARVSTRSCWRLLFPRSTISSGRMTGTPARSGAAARRLPAMAATSIAAAAVSRTPGDRIMSVLVSSKKLFDRLMPVVDDRHGTVRGRGQRRFDVDAQRVIDRRGHLRRRDRPIFRVPADLVGRSDDLPALDPAAAHQHRPAVRPMVASACGIHFGCASE